MGQEILVAEQKKSRCFEEFVLPHLDAAYNLARWITRDGQDAEDIVQEAYLRAFKFFKGFHGENGRAWLLAIVRNTSYTWLKENRKQESNTPFEEETHSSDAMSAAMTQQSIGHNPESVLAHHDELRLLTQALENLPLEFREIVVLRDLEDMSYKEIADVLEIPIGTVMSRIARGRRLLSERLMLNTQEPHHGL